MRSLLKKFRGWIFPAGFTPDYEHLDQNRHTIFIGALTKLRQAARGDQIDQSFQKLQERIVYIGCIHGGDEEIYNRLKALAKYPPDYLIFTGDITGSVEIERLKKQFYDERTKNPHGFLSQFPYFGNWAATLPRIKREKLLLGLQTNAEHLLSIMELLRKRMVKLYLIEGNWDNPEISGVRTIAGNDIKPVFNTHQFFERHGFHFINILEILETKTTLHLLLPYICLLRFDVISKNKIEEIQKKIRLARSQKKSIIMVGHAEANWHIHHLKQPDSTLSGDRKMVIRQFGRAMALFRPDEVIYPHQHERIRDEKGRLININAKYVLQVGDGNVHLVTNPRQTSGNNNQIVATYVPFGYMAEEDFVRN